MKRCLHLLMLLFVILFLGIPLLAQDDPVTDEITPTAEMLATQEINATAEPGAETNIGQVLPDDIRSLVSLVTGSNLTLQNTVAFLLVGGFLLFAIFGGFFLSHFRMALKQQQAWAIELNQRAKDAENVIPIDKLGDVANQFATRYERYAASTENDPLDDVLAKFAKQGVQLIFPRETDTGTISPPGESFPVTERT